MVPFKTFKTFASGWSYEICDDDEHTYIRQCEWRLNVAQTDAVPPNISVFYLKKITFLETSTSNSVYDIYKKIDESCGKHENMKDHSFIDSLQLKS